MIEVYGVSVDLILIARIIALLIFLLVAWRLTRLEGKVRHIEALTEHNFSEMKIRLADAIGTAEESVTRDHQRRGKEIDKQERQLDRIEAAEKTEEE